MAVRELIVFKHDSELGNAPAHKLFDTVHVERVEGVTARANTATTASGWTTPCRRGQL